ncbi:hypothetical protein F5Y15DRAFT_417169 [Xylariaceae sp. FL0016]|nr:hypothetical protein F5Y15DRAFT_417169 [Xylariaceae sp. FL0016]
MPGVPSNSFGSPSTLSIATTAPGGYAFGGSAPVAQRSAATLRALPDMSTLSTVITRSSVPNQGSSAQIDGPKPTDCGNPSDMGNFTFDLDDLPPLGVGAGVDPHSLQPMPMSIFNPYHRFWFSQGFSVLPPPPDPYVPSSGDLMLQFTPPNSSNESVPGSPLDAAQIGLGPQASSPCFLFNFHGISLGCDSDRDVCQFTFTGMKYDSQSKMEKDAMVQTVNVTACPAMNKCKLTPVAVSGFNSLSSILITGKVDDQAKIWWADDIALGWSDNDCNHADCRSKVRDSILKRRKGTFLGLS